MTAATLRLCIPAVVLTVCFAAPILVIGFLLEPVRWTKPAAAVLILAGSVALTRRMLAGWLFAVLLFVTTAGFSVRFAIRAKTVLDEPTRGGGHTLVGSNFLEGTLALASFVPIVVAFLISTGCVIYLWGVRRDLEVGSSRVAWTVSAVVAAATCGAVFGLIGDLGFLR